jgi:predicted AlkP superfamily pyrophosphatase or phosphodiesterase
MAHRTAVLLVVGLNRQLLNGHAPRLRAFARQATIRCIVPPMPAVTCSVQSSMLTGLPPNRHGIVGNGWYNRELAEVQFWKQSNHLVQGEKVWETARRRDPTVTTANICWWYNMYSSVDYSVTPRPIYKADGRKIPDCYSEPPELRERLQKQLGTFPLFQFWGPGSSIESSRWIAQASRLVFEEHQPTLTLVYLPHLDYALQKFGPDHPAIGEAAAEIDTVAGDLIDFLEGQEVRVVLAGEYGIEPVDGVVRINRVLRAEGALRVRDEQGLEVLDAGASGAFAVADHQVAHVYVKKPEEAQRYADLCRGLPGVEQVLNRAGQAQIGLDHARSGDLVLVAESGRWFSYDYWLDDARAPDFARTVDIHRKPGYDPAELFIDPSIRLPKPTIGWKLLKRRLGFRTLLDVIPLDPSLVKGSHGRVDQPHDRKPVLITKTELANEEEELPAVAVRDVILEHLFGGA